MTALAFVAVAMLACGGRNVPPPAEARSPAPTARAASDAYPLPDGLSPTVGDLFAINEAVAFPKRFALRAPQHAVDQQMEEQIDHLRRLGVRHIRVHSAVYPFLSWYGQTVELKGDTRRADEYLVRVLEAGLEPLVILGPWPGNHTASFTDRYVPEDMDGYLAWVRATVERYDGDGIDDAPGLPRGIHLWEIDNEPDLHHLAPPKGQRMAPKDFSTPDQFATVAIRSAEAIREADPKATVLPGGLLRSLDPSGDAYARELWSQEGFAAAMDGANVHAYPSTGTRRVWEAADRIAGYAPGEPLWITEVSTASVGDRRNEQDQAADLAHLYLEALRRGVARVYWHSLHEAPTVYAPQGHEMTRGRHLLIGRPEDVVQRGQMKTWRALHWKLSAWTLHRMIERWGEVRRSDVLSVRAEGGRALRIGADVVVWSGGPPVARRTVTVEVPFTGEVEVTSLIPEDADGASVADRPRWTTRRERVKQGTVTVDVAAGPVVLEAAEGE